MEQIRGLQRAAGNQAVTRMLLQRSIAVGGGEYGDRVYENDDLDEARADMPIVYGLDSEVAEAHLVKLMATDVRFGSEDAWRERIEADLTLPQNKRVSMLSTATRAAGRDWGYAIEWNGGRGMYSIANAGLGAAALPKAFFLGFDWVDVTGYAELASVQETVNEVVFRVRAPLRYWPEGTNQRTNHTNRVLGPAIAQVLDLVGSRAAPGGANLPGAPAVFSNAPAGAANAADHALVTMVMTAVNRRWEAEQERANARNSAADPSAPRRLARASELIELEDIQLIGILQKLRLDGHPDRGAALATFRETAAAEGEAPDKIQLAAELLRAPLERPIVAAAFAAHTIAASGAGLGALPDFAEDVVFDHELIHHVAFGSPRGDDDFIANGISGGHVQTQLEAFVAGYPEYDVLVEDEGSPYSVYKQFKWMPGRRTPAQVQQAGNGTLVEQREDSRPSGAGGRERHAGWIEAQFPKTVTDDVASYLTDAENSFRQWHATNAAIVAGIAPGGHHPLGAIPSAATQGIRYEGYLERASDQTLRLTTLYPVIG